MLIRPRSSSQSLFRFCPFCAVPLQRDPGQRLARPWCPNCRYVQYRNPVVGVAAILYEHETAAVLGKEAILRVTGQPPELNQQKVLLARRTTNYRGLYCLPCGYVEFDEDVREALEREVREETGLRIRTAEVAAVHSNFHDPDRQSVGIWFHAHPVGGKLRAGDDVDALVFADPAGPDVPLAFPTDAIVLREIATGGDQNP